MAERMVKSRKISEFRSWQFDEQKTESVVISILDDTRSRRGLRRFLQHTGLQGRCRQVDQCARLLSFRVDGFTTALDMLVKMPFIRRVEMRSAKVPYGHNTLARKPAYKGPFPELPRERKQEPFSGWGRSCIAMPMMSGYGEGI